jgi:phenol hydroxylase P4 protein
MPVKAIRPDYHGEMKDTVDKFHGKQLLNISWEHHLMFGWPMCVPLPPETPFAAVIEQVIPSIFSAHPDFAKIDWAQVIWRRSGEPFVPDRAKSLVENGLTHKTTISFRTPGLDGIAGTGT